MGRTGPDSAPATRLGGPASWPRSSTSSDASMPRASSSPNAPCSWPASSENRSAANQSLIASRSSWIASPGSLVARLGISALGFGDERLVTTRDRHLARPLKHDLVVGRAAYKKAGTFAGEPIATGSGVHPHH